MAFHIDLLNTQSALSTIGKDRHGALAHASLSPAEADVAFESAVAYVRLFYIRYSDNGSIIVQHVPEVPVKQTLKKHPTCLQMAELIHGDHIHLGTQETEDALLGLLPLYSQSFTIISCFLDGLDEAPHGVQVDPITTLW